jgi:hypothetical protein
VQQIIEWGSAAQFPPSSVLNTSHDLQNSSFDSTLGPFEPYPGQRMALSSVTQAVVGVPNLFEGYSLEGVGTPAVSIYSKPLVTGYSELAPRMSDVRMGGIDIQRKPLMEQQLEALRISATMGQMGHITPLDDYLSTYWQTFHTRFPIVHQSTFDPASNILLSAAVAAIGTQYHNTAAARQKGVDLNDYCRKNIDLVSMLASMVDIYF